MTSDFELMDYRDIAPLEAKPMLRESASILKQRLVNVKRIIFPSRRCASTNLETIGIGGKPKKTNKLGLYQY